MFILAEDLILAIFRTRHCSRMESASSEKEGEERLEWWRLEVKEGLILVLSRKRFTAIRRSYFFERGDCKWCAVGMQMLWGALWLRIRDTILWRRDGFAGVGFSSTVGAGVEVAGSEKFSVSIETNIFYLKVVALLTSLGYLPGILAV